MGSGRNPSLKYSSPKRSPSPSLPFRREAGDCDVHEAVGTSCGGKNKMEDKIEQFIAITGADRNVAVGMLEACNENIELAVEMHLDSGMGSSIAAGISSFSENSITTSTNRPNTLPDILQNSTGIESDSSSSTGFEAGNGDDNVRAPIPQVRAVLVDDPYHALPGYPRARGRNQNRSTVFDGFRDFQAEARRQEELLDSASAAGTSAAESSKNGTKIKTLQDLFRPPIDITFKGTFEAAKEAGTSQGKWLLVNIQDVKEFSCQVLNRDVWSNPLVRDLIAEHFILWQVYHDSEEGQRFMIYYPVKSYPHISILDPRTGERLTVWNRYEKFDSQLFCDLVTQFLASHPDLISEHEFPPEKRQKTDAVLEKSEDQQIAAAIAASLQEKSTWSQNRDDSSEEREDDGDIESFEYSDDESCSAKDKSTRNNDKASLTSEINQCANRIKENSLDKNYKDTAKYQVIEEGEDESKIQGPTTKLMLRLPQGNRKQIRMHVDASLKDLQGYITSLGFPDQEYEIVTNFPRRNLTKIDNSRTLKEENLFPQQTIFVQER